jgi:hypothetical protein
MSKFEMFVIVIVGAVMIQAAIMVGITIYGFAHAVMTVWS